MNFSLEGFDYTDINSYYELLIGASLSILPKIIWAILVFWIGFKVAHGISQWLRKIFNNQGFDPTVENFLVNLLRYILRALVILAVIWILWVQTSSFVALIAAAGFAKLLPNLEFWTYVFRLKQDILNLHEIKTNNIKNEADLLARETILSLYKSSREFKIKSWPLLHNTFIKLSKNARGYCYHYVENLKRDLGSQNWNFFTLAWVEAYSGKYREHNTLAIAKKGETIENSIIVDGWRNGSKPFWIRREDDHYPWKLYQVINNSAHKAPSSLSAAPQKAPKTEAP